jgi:hypothetical protein
VKLALIAKNLEFLTFNFIINFYYCSNSKVLNSLEKRVLSLLWQNNRQKCIQNIEAVFVFQIFPEQKRRFEASASLCTYFLSILCDFDID